MKCPKGDTCEHLQSKMNQTAYDDEHYNYRRCYKSCCLKCDNLALCKNACAHATEAQLKARQQKKAADSAAREAKKADAERQKELERSAVERHQAMYLLVKKRLGQLGLSDEPLMDIVGLEFRKADLKDYLEGGFKDLTASTSVLCTGMLLYQLDRLCAMADYLQMTVDQLIVHTPVSTLPAAEPIPAPTTTTWQTGDPTEPGAYAIRRESHNFIDIAYFDIYHQALSYSCDIWDPVPQFDDWRWLKIPEE